MTERKKFWEKLPPSDHKEKHLSTKGVKVAKAKARMAGRPAVSQPRRPRDRRAAGAYLARQELGAR